LEPVSGTHFATIHGLPDPLEADECQSAVPTALVEALVALLQWSMIESYRAIARAIRIPMALLHPVSNTTKDNAWTEAREKTWTCRKPRLMNTKLPRQSHTCSKWTAAVGALGVPGAFSHDGFFGCLVKLNIGLIRTATQVGMKLQGI
jgi:hypothetical protein